MKKILVVSLLILTFNKTKAQCTATVTQPADQTICSGNSTEAITFSGMASYYTWTSSNNSIGLSASGTGNINSFNAINNGTTAIVDTITVTPHGSSGYAYITNTGDNSVSIIDIASNAVTSTLNAAGTPEAITVSPDGTKLYITNYSDNHVSVINVATNTVTTPLYVGSNCIGVVVSPDGSRLYVANYNTGKVGVYNTSTNSLITNISIGDSPCGLAITPDGSKVYVTNTSNVSVISTASNTVIATVDLTLVGNPVYVFISPDGSKAYVTNLNYNTVSVINTSTNTISATINVGSGAYGGCFSPSGSKAYICNRYDGSVSVINTATNNVINTITGFNMPINAQFSPDGSKIYVTDQMDNNVKIIDPATNTLTGTMVAVGSFPYSLGNFMLPGCSGASQQFTITVLPANHPAINITANPSGPVVDGQQITFTAQLSNPGTNYQVGWLLDGQVIPGVSGNNWVATVGVDVFNNSSVAAYYVSSSPCTSPDSVTSSAIKVSIGSTSVNNIGTPEDFKVYPNPMHNLMYIEGLHVGDELSIFDILGRKLISRQVSKEGIYTLDIGDYPQGVYLVNFITTKNQIWQAKVTKTN